eukprot:5473448-Amphidinium_carterae.1
MSPDFRDVGERCLATEPTTTPIGGCKMLQQRRLHKASTTRTRNDSANATTDTFLHFPDVMVAIFFQRPMLHHRASLPALETAALGVCARHRCPAPIV